MSEHILIATDGSELATRGLERGLALARALGDRPTVVVVTEGYPVIPDMHGLAVDIDPVALDRHRDRQGTQAAGILRAASARAAAVGVEIDPVHIPDAFPAEAIVATALDRKATMIVMASHGHRGLKRMLMGSQTAEVLAHSPVPVLVVR